MDDNETNLGVGEKKNFKANMMVKDACIKKTYPN